MLFPARQTLRNECYACNSNEGGQKHQSCVFVFVFGFVCQRKHQTIYNWIHGIFYSHFNLSAWTRLLFILHGKKIKGFWQLWNSFFSSCMRLEFCFYVYLEIIRLMFDSFAVHLMRTNILLTLFFFFFLIHFCLCHAHLWIQNTRMCESAKTKTKMPTNGGNFSQK